MSLSPTAQNLINDYLNLPFKNKTGVKCPYFNNARLKQRGQLRSLIGKGTPQEIVEEAKISAKQYGIDLKNLNNEELTKFLVEHNLGIECSGFVTNVLQKHFLEKYNLNLIKKIFIPTKNWLRKMVVCLRKIENIDVKVLADQKNSSLISDWKKTQAGDIIILLEIEPHKRNHIILITENKDGVIKYVHARCWSSEGRYNHGVQIGKIVIIDKEAEILKQQWLEKDKTNEENETYLETKNAKILEIRRIKID